VSCETWVIAATCSTTKEIMRILKRYVARELYPYLAAG